ncbi:hypothetical protein MASR2M78_00290 [Treponema sp.]
MAIVSVALFAQTDTVPTDENVFAPFVTRLSAELRDSSIRLTWKDSTDASGPLFVFRSREAFSTPLTDDWIATVPYGAQSFIDRPPEAGRWYYLSQPSAADSTRYDILLPYGNLAAADAKKEEIVQSIQNGSEAKPATSGSTLFSGIAAKNSGDAVIISFISKSLEATALLYRSAQPLLRTQDLLDAVIVQASAALSPFIDYPVPGIPYYYALIAENELRTGNITFIVGENSTRGSVEVPSGRYRLGLPGPQDNLRSMPLPLVSIEAALPYTLSENQYPLSSSSLSPEATKAIAELFPTNGNKNGREKKARVFPQDLQAPAGGEEYTLRFIVQDTFARRDWKNAATQLSSFLSLPRTSSTEARARFYLGQSYYFLGRPQESLFEFLLVKSQYPIEADEWVQAILPKLIE